MVKSKKMKKYIAVGTIFGMISVTAFYNHTPEQVEHNIQAAVKVDETIKGECFKEEFLSSRIEQTNGLTVISAYYMLISSQADIELEHYWSTKNTIGYTYKNVKKIWMNEKYHNKYSVCESAQNLGHEYSHKIGFGHEVKFTKTRQYSVPYQVGRIIGKCCK